MNQHAYTTLEIKAADDTGPARRFTGIASTITPDRSADIVEPKGFRAAFPLPLLWQHDKSKPIGWVKSALASDGNIEVLCELAQIAESGPLKDRLDEAWQSIKAGLVKGLSIGFKPIDAEPIKGSFGIRFKAWEWLELSAVTIAANAEANILAIKSADSQYLPAASGQTSPGVSGTPPKVKLSKPKDNAMNIADQIKTYNAEKAMKSARLVEIMSKSADEGATLDPQAADEFATLETEIKSIDSQLARFQVLQNLAAATAKPVESTPAGPGQGSAVEIKGFAPQIKPAMQKDGIAFAQVVKCLGLAQGNWMYAKEIAKSIGDRLDPRAMDYLNTKANVPAANTTQTTWAAPLIQSGGAVADFVAYLRPQTILGKLEGRMRRVPFNVPLVTQTSGGAGYWVGEGKAKPLTKWDYTRTTMTPLKVANIAVATMELLRDSSPSADANIRDTLVDALKERLDRDFVDPAKAAVAGISPASIINGVTPVTASGTNEAAIRADFKALMAKYVQANNPPSSGVWIMDSIIALSLSMMTNPLGQSVFPSINMNGGTWQGMPVIVSDFVTRDSGGSSIILVNASDVYFADEGGFDLAMSSEASLEMSDAPAHNSTTPTPAQLVSMFQTNSVAFRAERSLNWMKRVAGAAQWIDNANYA